MTMTTMMVSTWLLTLALVATAAAQPRETAGLIAELKLAGGAVEVRTAGGPWKPAAPLQALRGGDELRATGAATATVLLSGGRGTAKVAAANSPYAVAAPGTGPSQADKARTLVSDSMKFLASGPKEPPKAVLATRSVSRPPQVLTPRDGPVLPGPLVFEWVGNPSARYTVKLTGPSDVVLERTGVVGPRLEYPASAPALRPGVIYRFEVIAQNQPPSASTFELVDPARATAVQDDLRALEAAIGPSASPTSVAVARAGYLAENGLLHDARQAVVGALARDPDEPVLHTLLGSLYAKTGLSQQAAEAFDEAQFLMTRGR